MRRHTTTCDSLTHLGSALQPAGRGFESLSAHSNFPGERSKCGEVAGRGPRKGPERTWASQPAEGIGRRWMGGTGRPTGRLFRARCFRPIASTCGQMQGYSADDYKPDAGQNPTSSRGAERIYRLRVSGSLHCRTVPQRQTSGSEGKESDQTPCQFRTGVGCESRATGINTEDP
jgi:hypothetical protein